MESGVASLYIRENFDPQDRLAVVLINRRSQHVVQRLASAETIASNDFQDWLDQLNAQRYDIHLSMNSLAPNASGRTKADVAGIRHIYLDFDEGGTAKVNSLLKDQTTVPQPNYLISTSPGKWQVVLKVEGFAAAHAETLQRGVARDLGADPAATDNTRVLRPPGFRNHKYAQPCMVGVERLAVTTCRREHFPEISVGEPG